MCIVLSQYYISVLGTILLLCFNRSKLWQQTQINRVFIIQISHDNANMPNIADGGLSQFIFIITY